MRRALIVGANGQDGRLLGDLLLARGYAVRGWTRRLPTKSMPFACTVVDLLDERSVAEDFRSFQPDEIYYLAAFHHSTEDHVEVTAAELLRRSFDIHVHGLLNVLRAIKTFRASARLFYAASSHVFGAPAGDLQDEQTSLSPNSAYGISKVAGVQACRLCREQEGVFAAVGFLFNHESSLRPSSFLSQKIVRGALRARLDPAFKLTLGDLEARVDWGYAPDYVDAMYRILQLPHASDFVVASGETHSVREFATIAFDAVGLDWRQHVHTDPSLIRKRLQTLCGDATKLRGATGWAPKLGFEEMVRVLMATAQARSSELILQSLVPPQPAPSIERVCVAA